MEVNQDKNKDIRFNNEKMMAKEDFSLMIIQENVIFIDACMLKFF